MANRGKHLLSVSSVLQNVTVYREGATIERVGELPSSPMQEGGLVCIPGLPLTLDDSSVRVALSGAPSGLRASSIRIVLDVPGIDPLLSPADSAEIESLELELQKLRGRAMVLERDIAAWSRMPLVERGRGRDGQAPGASPLAARLALLEFRASQQREARELLAGLRVQERELVARLETLHAEEDGRSSARQVREHELRKAAVIQLAGAGETGGQLRVTYFVPGACWAPAYAIRLDEDLSSATLAMRAMVSQNSGEDWTQARLRLSTAESQRWSDLPELKSLRLGRRQKPPAKIGWRPPPPGGRELYRDYDRAMAATARPSAPAPALATRAPARQRAETAPFSPVDEAAMVAASVAVLEEHELAASAAPPAPMRPMAAMPGGLMPPEARRAPPPAPMKRRQLAKAREGRVTSAQEPEALPTVVEAAEDLLQYARLRMPAADSEQRGSLVLAAREELYLEMLVRRELTVELDIQTVLHEAEHRAHSVRYRLPPGHLMAHAEDFDYAYDAQQSVDVPSDGEFHCVPMFEGRAASKPLYVVVPRESCDVFRTTQVKNPFEAPLLAGPVDVYWSGNFLLTSSMGFTPPAGSVSLGLGVDQSIKVSRNTQYREETVGLMGGALALAHKIAIEAVNLSDRRVALEVRERVPVTRKGEEDLEVEIKKVSPPWEPDARMDDASQPLVHGAYVWRIALEPRGKAELSVSYDIRLSSKLEIVGGNRREW